MQKVPGSDAKISETFKCLFFLDFAKFLLGRGLRKSLVCAYLYF